MKKPTDALIHLKHAAVILDALKDVNSDAYANALQAVEGAIKELIYGMAEDVVYECDDLEKHHRTERNAAGKGVL